MSDAEIQALKDRHAYLRTLPDEVLKAVVSYHDHTCSFGEDLILEDEDEEQT